MPTKTDTETLMDQWDAQWSSFKEWKQGTHLLAVRTVLHVYKHRNATVIIHALDKMEKAGKGADRQALVDWFKEYSPCTIEWNAKAKSFEATMLKKDRAEVVKALADGNSKPWYDFARKPKFKGWDINEALQSVLTQGNSALKKAKVEYDAGKPVPEVKLSRAKMDAIRAILAMPDEVVSFAPQAPANEERPDDQVMLTGTTG